MAAFIFSKHQSIANLQNPRQSGFLKKLIFIPGERSKAHLQLANRQTIHRNKSIRWENDREQEVCSFMKEYSDGQHHVKEQSVFIQMVK